MSILFKRFLAAGKKQKWLLTCKIGVIALLLAVLGLWAPVIGSELLEMPADYTYSANILSYDNLYDQQLQQYTGRTQSQTTFTYKTQRVEGETNIIDTVFDVRTQNGEPIFSVERQYGIEHHSLTHISGHGDKDREGYLFGPAKYNKNNFTYWHINYDQPLTMTFSKEESVLGLNTYAYTCDFTADQTANLTNLPDVGKTKGINLDGQLTLWIEPYSGELVKYQDSATAYYYDLATGERLSPWNQFSNQYSFDSISQHVALAEQKKNQIFIISEVIPAVLFTLIAAFTAWCALDVKKIWQLRANSTVIAVNSAIIMCSIIIISAWLINSSSNLITLFGTTSETHPASATMYILICLCNIFLSSKTSISRRQSAILRTVLTLVIIGSATNIVFAVADWHIWLAGAKTPVLAVTSLGTALLAAATFASSSNRLTRTKNHLHVIFAALAIFLGVVSILGNAYQFSYAYVDSWYRCATTSTALLFITLAIAEWNLRFSAKSKILKLLTSRALALSLVLFLIGVAITGIGWNVSKESVSRNATLRFENDTNKIEGLITQKINSYKYALQGATSLFGASDNVTRQDWKAYVDGLRLTENFPGNQGLGYAVIIPAAQKPQFQNQMRALGFTNYTIQSTQTNATQYVPTAYIEPLNQRNTPSLGYDSLSDPVRSAAMQLTQDTGEVTMSGKVELITAATADQRTGFVLYEAVYRNGTVNNSVHQRQNNIQGYVLSPISIKIFMQAAVGDQSNGVNITIFDTPDASQLNDQNKLFTSNALTDTAKSDLKKTTQLYICNHVWTIQYANEPGYIATSSTIVSLYVLLSGLGISLLLAIAFFGVVSSRQRALRLARTMTRSLETEKDKAVHVQQKDEAILASIGEGLILYSPAGAIERINAAALRMLGYTSDEVVGKRFTDIIKATDNKKQAIAHGKRPSVLAVQKNTAIKTKINYKRKNDSTFPVEITVAPIRAHGRIIGAIEVFRDITEEVALDQAKTDFISLASHQLRTPLTTNKWYLELLLSGEGGKLKPAQSEFVRKINDSNEHLIELVVSLLNVTRIDSGRIAITPKPTDMHKLINGVVETVKPKLAAKKQRITVTIPELPKIMLDDTLIRQVVLNLLTNAIKYSPKDTTVHVSAQKQNDSIVCEVTDEGYGIPEDQQKYTYDKFFRARNIAQKEPDGNGLGLYLVKQIVEASGGKIWFTSVQNKGTSFYFSLPIHGVRAKKGEVSLEERANQ